MSPPIAIGANQLSYRPEKFTILCLEFTIYDILLANLYPNCACKDTKNQ